MNSKRRSLIGIRLDPDTDVADWYTLWFEDDAPTGPPTRHQAAH